MFLSCFGGMCLLSSVFFLVLFGCFFVLDLMVFLVFLFYWGVLNGGLFGVCCGGGVVSVGLWFLLFFWNFFLGVVFGFGGVEVVMVLLFCYLSLLLLFLSNVSWGGWERDLIEMGVVCKEYLNLIGYLSLLVLVFFFMNGSMVEIDCSSLFCFDEEEVWDEGLVNLWKKKGLWEFKNSKGS